MKKTFKVIEVKTIERDGDDYEYVSDIGLDDNGNIVIYKTPDVLNAMRFNEWGDGLEAQGKLRKQFIELVRSYFIPKSKHEISYKFVTVDW